LAIFSLIEYLRPYVFPENPDEKKIQIIIVENQLATFMENPRSFLDDFGLPVLYTKSNTINTQNKGRKEWEDVQLCINKFNIKEDDFVVKITGRYIVIQQETFFEGNGQGNFVRDIGSIFNLYNQRFEKLTSGIGNIIQKSEEFYDHNIVFKPYFLSFLVDNFIINEDKQTTDCMIRYGSYNDKVSKIPINDCVTGLIGMRCKYIKLIPEPEENDCVEHLWAKVSLQISDDKVEIFEKMGIYITPATNAYFIV
jgi:hypothetical protein